MSNTEKKSVNSAVYFISPFPITAVNVKLWLYLIAFHAYTSYESSSLTGIYPGSHWHRYLHLNPDSTKVLLENWHKMHPIFSSTDILHTISTKHDNKITITQLSEDDMCDRHRGELYLKW